MGLGEYIATKSQENVNRGEFALEEEHFKYHRDVEIEQLRGFLQGVGLEGNLLEAVVSQVGGNDKALMKMMQAFEFSAGNDETERNPLLAMYTSGRLFIMGSIPAVIPFFWVRKRSSSSFLFSRPHASSSLSSPAFSFIPLFRPWLRFLWERRGLRRCPSPCRCRRRSPAAWVSAHECQVTR